MERVWTLREKRRSQKEWITLREFSIPRKFTRNAPDAALRTPVRKQCRTFYTVSSSLLVSLCGRPKQNEKYRACCRLPMMCRPVYWNGGGGGGGGGGRLNHKNSSSVIFANLLTSQLKCTSLHAKVCEGEISQANLLREPQFPLRVFQLYRQILITETILLSRAPACKN